MGSVAEGEGVGDGGGLEEEVEEEVGWRRGDGGDAVAEVSEGFGEVSGCGRGGREARISQRSCWY